MLSNNRTFAGLAQKYLNTDYDKVVALAENLPSVINVNAGMTNINTVYTKLADIAAVKGKLLLIGAVGGKLNEIEAVAPAVNSITTVAGNIPQVLSVASNIGSVTNVAASVNKVSIVAASINFVTTVANSIAEVINVSNNMGSITTAVNILNTAPSDNNFTTPLKNKLDNIEDNAEVNDTANELLVKLKTVDINGGAGVNAGTLGGALPDASLSSDSIVKRTPSGKANFSNINLTNLDVTTTIPDNVVLHSAGVSLKQQSWSNFVNFIKSSLGVGDGKLTQKNFTTTLKSKLDSIASNAEVNDSASSLLAKLKTVDVNGSSGLNAGTLDGASLSAGVSTNTVVKRSSIGVGHFSNVYLSNLTSQVTEPTHIMTHAAGENFAKIPLENLGSYISQSLHMEVIGFFANNAKVINHSNTNMYPRVKTYLRCLNAVHGYTVGDLVVPVGSWTPNTNLEFNTTFRDGQIVIRMYSVAATHVRGYNTNIGNSSTTYAIVSTDWEVVIMLDF